jgi:large subunit ribosomal protein L19e
MVDVYYQRRMAAEILKCGINRVWIDPDQVDEVAEAVTRGDIRRLISYRVIQVRQKRGISRGRIRKMSAQRLKGRRKGHGSRRGRKHARSPRKRTWIRTIRPIRAELRSLREEGKLNPTTYRTYYRKARGAMFRSRGDLLTRLEAAGVISEGEVKAKESARDRQRREREERRRKAQAARARVRRKAAEARAAREREQATKAQAEKAATPVGEPPKEAEVEAEEPAADGEEPTEAQAETEPGPKPEDTAGDEADVGSEDSTEENDKEVA